MAKSVSLTIPDLVVLSLLAERPMHGYQINQELTIREVKDWADISRPQVYYSIDKLAKLGVIRPVRDPEGSSGPERQLYSPTSLGLQELSSRLSQKDWATDRSPPRFLTWLALSSHTSKQGLRQVIQTRRSFLDGQLEKERKTLAELQSDSGEMVVAARLMVSLTIQCFELELRWLDQVEETLLQNR